MRAFAKSKKNKKTNQLHSPITTKFEAFSRGLTQACFIEVVNTIWDLCPEIQQFGIKIKPLFAFLSPLDIPLTTNSICKLKCWKYFFCQTAGWRDHSFIAGDPWTKAEKIKVWTNVPVSVSDHCYHGFPSGYVMSLDVKLFFYVRETSSYTTDHAMNIWMDLNKPYYFSTRNGGLLSSFVFWLIVLEV